MIGFNQGAVIPQRSLSDVKPMRFSLIVRIHPEKEPSEYIVMPESVKKWKDSTRGWFGTIVSVGDKINGMKEFKLIEPGAVCLFDESISVDDPNRCFDDGTDRYVLMDIETLMGIMVKGKPIMLGDRVLVRRPKREEFKLLGKLFIPQAYVKQEVGGVVIAVGPGLGKAGMDFKPNDFILFGKFSGTDIKIGGVDHVVVRQDKILAKVEGEAERIAFTA